MILLELFVFGFSLLALTLFLVAWLVDLHRWSAECTADSDCLGATSACHRGRCLCDIVYVTPAWQCDPDVGVPVDPIMIIAAVAGWLAIVSCCVLGARRGNLP